jgi:hypothetical protein
VVDHVLSKQNPRFKRLVDTVARADRLTLVIGAGASMDAGLPKWRDLVRTFLESGFEAAKARHLVTQAHDVLAKDALDHLDTISAATLGRFLWGDQRDRRIADALYGTLTARPSPGRVAKAIVSLAHAMGSSLRIVTTNYDDILEHEIRQARQVPLRVRSTGVEGLDTLEDGGQDSVDICHLHGFAPYDEGPVGPLVLDDQDFALSPVRPPGEILPTLLDDSPTIFLGLSMSDPNLVAACYLVANQFGPDQLPWFGLFVAEESEVHEETDDFIKRRLMDMGITPVDLVSYGQISQILYEVVYCQALGADAYWSDTEPNRYGRRLMAWREGLDHRYPFALGGDGFPAQQAELHRQLAALMDELRDGLLRNAHADEHFALHLWVRRPSGRLGALELWGSSAHLHRDGWSLDTQTIEIQEGTEIPALDSVYYAAVHRRNLSENPRSRWKAVLAVPVITSGDRPFANLIVGSITLSSTKTLTKSVIGHTDERALIDRLHEFALRWLSP